MRFLFPLLALSSTLAAAVPAVPRDAAEDTPLIQAWNQKDYKGDKIVVGTIKDVESHPEQDGSTAVCWSVEHDFLSSMIIAPIGGNPWDGGKPLGCHLYAEEKCTGDTVEVQQSSWADVKKLSDLNNFGFDKKTQSVKCWFKESWEAENVEKRDGEEKEGEGEGEGEKESEPEGVLAKVRGWISKYLGW